MTVCLTCFQLSTVETSREAFASVETYEDLVGTVKRIELPEMACVQTPLMPSEITVDRHSLPLVPDNMPVVPVEIYGDGNCLPRAVSLHAYHTEDLHEEMRYRIVVELVNNETWYLSDELDAGGSKTKCAGTFAMFSEQFAGQSFEVKSVQDIFREEVVTIIQNGSYMGAWQIAAVASVLRSPVQSVYPQYASQTVRNDLHRLFHPRSGCSTDTEPNCTEPMMILWTSTQGVDLTPKTWRPNHFVLLVER